MGDLSELEYGQLEQTGDRWVLHFTRHLTHPPARVWRALTEAEHLEGWFPTTIEGERSPGAVLTFGFREMDIPSLQGRMLSFQPPELLEFAWGDDVMVFELRAEGDGCLLVVSANFADLGKAARDATGWHVCLEQLAFVVDGDPLPWDPAAHWKDVHPRYVEHLGPEASTMGPPEEWDRVHGDATGG
jgi:uncharacterized protein YndB with AHSA1/START domain